MENGNTGDADRGSGASHQGAERFGMSNLEYDIVATVSNLPQGHEALERYARDVDQAGDNETATIFRTLRENNRATVQQLRKSLSRQLSTSTTTF